MYELPQWLVWTVLAVSVLLLAALVVWLRRRRREPTVDEVLDRIALESMNEVVLPDGLDGEIQIERLLLTPRGLLAVDVKEVQGIVFAGERLDEWTVMDGSRRYSFKNPLGAMADRVAALRFNAPELPAQGVVLFGPRARFRGQPPQGVSLLADLAQRYGRQDEAGRRSVAEAFAPHWARLRERCRRA